MPEELTKEFYLITIFFFIFIFIIYRKAASWGSSYVSLYKFYYGGATNWNNLPPNIEPEWYFWVFYFALASASSLSGGLFRIFILFAFFLFLPLIKEIQSIKGVDSVENSSLNTGISFFFLILFFIFFNRSKGS